MGVKVLVLVGSGVFEGAWVGVLVATKDVSVGAISILVGVSVWISMGTGAGSVFGLHPLNTSAQVTHMKPKKNALFAIYLPIVVRSPNPLS